MYTPLLKTFFTVVESGSFSKAADQLFMTPSAVLHKIRSLEKDLGVELFTRTSRGVSLTPAGSYLQQQGKPFMQMGDDLRRRIRTVSTEDSSICIGTSMLEKCRLLYDLWVLFSAEEPDCGISMVNIDFGHNIPDATDLIESLNSEMGWMREWEFFEVCQVPFGFAFSRNHPLAGREVIRLQDLREETVLSINEGSCETIVRLLGLLRENGVNVVYNQIEGMSAFWASAFTRDVQLVPMCFHDILINLTVVPFELSFTLPYGFFYRRNPSPTARRFLEFIRLTYGEGNRSGIVPVLI